MSYIALMVTFVNAVRKQRMKVSVGIFQNFYMTVWGKYFVKLHNGIWASCPEVVYRLNDIRIVSKCGIFVVYPNCNPNIRGVL